MQGLKSVFVSEGGNNLAESGANFGSRTLDLNFTIDVSKNEGIDSKDDFVKAGGLDVDLNVEDTSTSINDDQLHPCKKDVNLKIRNVSECGSSVGLFDEKDSMNVWKEIKHTGYVSSGYGGVPKPRERTKNDVLRKKMELGKKEKIDRFARIAAPSGLLNGLNPGIINHVRNSKQVHSIIEAIVTSERNDNRRCGSKRGDRVKSDLKEQAKRMSVERVDCSKAKERGFSGDMVLGSRQPKSCPWSSQPVSLNFEIRKDDVARIPPQFRRENEGDGVILKLLSATDVSESNSSLSNDSANLTIANSLSVEAASVASQWLDLLNQDIKGRISALRRSKKRIRAVIQTELPFLQSIEFSSNQENSKSTTKDSAICCPDRATSEAHHARWSTFFGQMDNTLSEEENHLENWLNQVKEMQLHCARGLYKSNLCASQLKDLIGKSSRLGEVGDSEKDLAMRAAAASIYSTCTFLFQRETNHIDNCCNDKV